MQRLPLHLVAILLIAIVLRLPAVVIPSMTGDEMSTVYQASFSFTHVLHRLASMEIADADIAPPLYFILLNGFLSLFSFTVWGVRLLSVFFDLLTIWGAYTFLSRENMREAGLYSALFIACSPYQIWYGTEIRMYAMVSFFSLFSTLLLSRYIVSGRKNFLLAYCLFASAGLYTQYYFGLLIMAQGLTMFFFLDRGQWKYGAGAMLAIGISFIPWIKPLLVDLNIIQHQQLPVQDISVFAFGYVLVKLLVFGNRFFLHSYPLIYVIGILLLLLFCVKFVSRIKRISGIMGVISLTFGLAVFFLSLLSVIKPQTFRPHASIFLLPLGLLLIAYLTAARTRYNHILRVSLLLLWGTVLLLYNYNPLFGKSRVKEGAEILSIINVSKEPVINLPLQIPCPRTVFPGSYQVWAHYVDDRSSLHFLQGEQVDDLMSRLAEITEEEERFYLIYYQHFFPPPYYNEFFDQVSIASECLYSIRLDSKVDTFPITIGYYSKQKKALDLDP